MGFLAGAITLAETTAASGTDTAASEAPDPPHAEPTEAKDETALAAVAYVLTWLTGLIIFLVADKNDQYTRYHALQAIGFGVVVVIVYVAVGILVAVFAAAGAGAVAAAFGVATWLLWVLVIIAIILMAVKAYQGSKFRLPLIADIAEKNA